MHKPARHGKNALPSLRIVRKSDDEFASFLPFWAVVDVHSEIFNGTDFVGFLRQGDGPLIGGQFAE
jgi:hypothetical protein